MKFLLLAAAIINLLFVPIDFFNWAINGSWFSFALMFVNLGVGIWLMRQYLQLRAMEKMYEDVFSKR